MHVCVSTVIFKSQMQSEVWLLGSPKRARTKCSFDGIDSYCDSSHQRSTIVLVEKSCTGSIYDQQAKHLANSWINQAPKEWCMLSHKIFINLKALCLVYRELQTNHVLNRTCSLPLGTSLHRRSKAYGSDAKVNDQLDHCVCHWCYSRSSLLHMLVS